ncbi:MAG TPA: aldo/keto reductase [Gemmatimonadales bacterium]|nr:aldo/keto reductase [Gemmatimonadales bacterium]
MSEIGFGAWGIGGAMWQGGDDGAALAALGAAYDLGVTFVDTALAYGDGHSERLVARSLASRAEPVVVATKLPPANRIWPAPPGTALAAAFPAGHVTRSAETSAANLGRPIDLLQFHVWRDEWLREDEWKRVERALDALVAAGTVRHVGISINDHDPDNGIEAVRHCDLIEVVQVIYNVFDQSPERNLFPACRDREAGVIVRVPLDEGGLTGAVRPGVQWPRGDWRNRYFGGDRAAEVARRVTRLEPVLRREAASLVEGALRFCLSHDAVGTVIVGMRTPEHARANAAVSDGRKLSPGLLAELKEHQWDRNFYG